MDKFLFFCLFSLLTSAHGVGPNLPEEGEGGRIQALSLDPRADLRLHPAKGETLWFEKKKFIKIPGYSAPFKIPGNVEITLSPIALKGDLEVVNRGLHRYNRKRMSDFAIRLLRHSSQTDPVGMAFQESVKIDLEALIQNKAPSTWIPLLKSLEAVAYGQGARRSYVLCDKKRTEEANSPFDLLVEVLPKNGYSLISESVDLQDGRLKRIFYSEFQAPISSENEDITCKLHEDVDEGVMAPHFGLFVRKNGKIRGGLFGSLHVEGAYIPHAFIDVLWMDERLRGFALGTKLMNFALDHCRHRGALQVELETMEFQAPKFYEKMGFRPKIIYPRQIKTKDGCLNNSYVYRKVL